MTIPSDRNIALKEIEKNSKYKDLQDQQRLTEETIIIVIIIIIIIIIIITTIMMMTIIIIIIIIITIRNITNNTNLYLSIRTISNIYNFKSCRIVYKLKTKYMSTIENYLQL